MAAIAGIDAERSTLYLDLIRMSLSESAVRAFAANIDSLEYECERRLARHYFEEGKAAGRMEAQKEIVILKVLGLRFGPLPEEIQARVRSAQDTQLDALVERSLTAQSLEEAFGALQR